MTDTRQIDVHARSNQRADKGTSTSGPVYLQLEPAGRCNLSCPMCAVSLRRETPPALLDWNTFARLLDEIPTLERIHLQGQGEPLLHPRFFEMVRYAARRGLRVSTSTNLTLLTPAMAADCVRSSLHEIHISIDSGAAGRYEMIRMPARFDRFCENLESLTNERKRAGSALPKIRFVAVLMRSTMRDLPELVRLARRFGVGEVHGQPICHDLCEVGVAEFYRPVRDFIAKERLTPADEPWIAPHVEAAHSEARAGGVRLRLPTLRTQAAPSGGGGRCDWPWTAAYITHRGDVLPCCVIASPDRFRLASVAKSSFAQIWNGPAYRAFRAQLSSPEPPDICRSCAIYQGTF